MEIPKLKYLRITGDVSVEPVTTRIPQDPYPFLYFIMGPTGAGKSSFIEAFAGESQKLSISKDQLAGYTQTVTAYRLVNVVHIKDNPPRPVYLVDTPGFSDSKISEIEVVNMVKKWSQVNGFGYSHAIFYLTPITETRLPRSRRKTFHMLQALFNGLDYSLVIVTTMWDTVHSEWTRNRAESNFAQLRDETLKGFVNDPRTDIIKFTNTRNSALQTIGHRDFPFLLFTNYNTSFSSLLYQDLHDRIQGALQERQMIKLDLAQPEVQTDFNLRAILQSNQRENHKTLMKFINQFVNFGYLLPGCRDAALHLRKSIAANTRPVNMKQRILFRIWELEDESSDYSAGHGGWYGIPDTSDLLTDLGRLTLNASKRRAAKLFKRGE